MARFPVQFPEDWPDFVVTSHKRESGSHSTGNAFDIAIVWPSGDYSPESRYWYYYFHTFFVLWALQGQGITYLAVPRTCPHLHIHFKQSVNKVGLEWMNKVGGKCVSYYVKSVSKSDLLDSIRFRTFVENIVGSGGGRGKYLNSWGNTWHGFKEKFNFSKRWVNVTSGFESLPDAKLQIYLDAMYGGSTGERFLNEMSQIVTGITWDGLRQSLAGNTLLYGTLATICFFLFMEHRKGKSQNSEHPDSIH